MAANKREQVAKNIEGLYDSKSKLEKQILSYGHSVFLKLFRERAEENADTRKHIRKIVSDVTSLLDRRTTSEYVFDMIAGWLVEDYILDEYMPKAHPDIQIIKAGGDRERVILSQKKVKTYPDFLFTVGEGIKLHVELMADHTGFWKENKMVDFRCNKYNEMSDFDAVCMLYDIKSNDIRFYRHREDRRKGKIEKLERHPIWREKGAYRLHVNFNRLANSIDKYDSSKPDEESKAYRSYLKDNGEK